MIKQNLHTHSVYCDGKDTIDQMVQTAIQKGFTILGFSGHGPCRYDEVAMKEEDHHALVERMTTRHGLRQLTYMKELGMGNDLYTLVDIDHDDQVIDAKEAVEGVVPFKRDDE